MSTLAIVEAFTDLPDTRRGAARRHDHALCLALFTSAISTGYRGLIRSDANAHWTCAAVY